MAIILNSVNAILDSGYLYDLNVPARHSSIPPVTQYENFISLVIKVNGIGDTGLPPTLLLSSYNNVSYYLTAVENHRIIGDYNLNGTFKDKRFLVPARGFLKISKEPFYIPKITNIFCPINTRAILNISNHFSESVIGFIILGRRNSLLSKPFPSPSVLQQVSTIVSPGTTQVKVNLEQGMTIMHKYQFSIMVLEMEGLKYYSNNFIELFPSGKTKQSIYGGKV